MDEPPNSLALTTILGSAHGMRNDLAAIRSVVQLTEDPEIREALATATSSLQRSIERVVVTARIEQAPRDAPSSIDAASLVELATRRHRREGATTISPATVHSTLASAEQVHLVVALTERLIADLLHLSNGAADLAATARGVELAVIPDEPSLSDQERYLRALSEASGCTLDVSPDAVRLVMPRSVGDHVA